MTTLSATQTYSLALFASCLNERAQSNEGKRIQTVSQSIVDRFYIPETYKIIKILEVLKHSKGYATAAYVSKKIDLGVGEIEFILNSNEQFKKSLIKGKKGENVYFLNKRFGGLIDIWKAFQYLSAMKC